MFSSKDLKPGGKWILFQSLDVFTNIYVSGRMYRGFRLDDGRLTIDSHSEVLPVVRYIKDPARSTNTASNSNFGTIVFTIKFPKICWFEFY
jgi:hypothetical protein